jgi:hypothetical protein
VLYEFEASTLPSLSLIAFMLSPRVGFVFIPEIDYAWFICLFCFIFWFIFEKAMESFIDDVGGPELLPIVPLLVCLYKLIFILTPNPFMVFYPLDPLDFIS